MPVGAWHTLWATPSLWVDRVQVETLVVQELYDLFYPIVQSDYGVSSDVLRSTTASFKFLEQASFVEFVRTTTAELASDDTSLWRETALLAAVLLGDDLGIALESEIKGLFGFDSGAAQDSESLKATTLSVDRVVVIELSSGQAFVLSGEAVPVLDDVDFLEAVLPVQSDLGTAQDLLIVSSLELSDLESLVSEETSTTIAVLVQAEEANGGEEESVVRVILVDTVTLSTLVSRGMELVRTDLTSEKAATTDYRRRMVSPGKGAMEKVSRILTPDTRGAE